MRTGWMLWERWDWPGCSTRRGVWVRPLAHAGDPLGTARELDDKAYALDHIEVKLAILPATMQTAAGRRLGEERLQWLRQFQADFVAEWGAGLTV